MQQFDDSKGRIADEGYSRPNISSKDEYNLQKST